MEILRELKSKFQGWRLLFVVCWALFVVWLTVQAIPTEPVYRDPDFFPVISTGERILYLIGFLAFGVAVSFAIPSEKLTQEEVSDKVALMLTVVGLFVVLVIASGIYTERDAIEERWYEQTTDCADLAIEISADQQCLRSDSCTMSREELMASNDRAEKYETYCSAN